MAKASNPDEPRHHLYQVKLNLERSVEALLALALDGLDHGAAAAPSSSAAAANKPQPAGGGVVVSIPIEWAARAAALRALEQARGPRPSAVR